jgi:hypothetical protein
MKKSIALFILTILVVVMGWQCTREQPEPLSRQMWGQIALLPDSAPAIGYVNIQSIKDSPFFTFIEDSMGKKHFHSDEYQEFMDATGLDLRRDIHEIYFCFFPEKRGAHRGILAVVNGSYQPDNILNYIRKHENEEILQQETYQNFTIYGLDDNGMSICFADSNQLIGGNPHMVRQWLDNYKARNQKINPQTLERIRSLRYKNQGWVSVDVRTFIDDVTQAMQHHPEARRFEGLKSMEDINFSMKMERNLKFSGSAMFNSKETARLFKEAIKGWIATAKLAVSQERKAVNVLNKIRVDSHGNQVSVRFSMTREDIETLKKSRPALVRR